MIDFCWLSQVSSIRDVTLVIISFTMLYLSALHVNEVFVKGLGGVVLVHGEVVVLVGVLDSVGGTVVTRRCCSMFS